MILGLLDTGARAQEFLNLNLEDIELTTRSAVIRQGKGRKPRMVFLGRRTIRAIRVYFRFRWDTKLLSGSPSMVEVQSIIRLSC